VEDGIVRIISVSTYVIPGAPIGSGLAFKIVYELVAGLNE
jgi:hypothetical protein